MMQKSKPKLNPDGSLVEPIQAMTFYGPVMTHWPEGTWEHDEDIAHQQMMLGMKKRMEARAKKSAG
jgi:hypothetical protein